jgi:hypothetical protein
MGFEEEHPAPWRWRLDDAGNEIELLDAFGKVVLGTGPGGKLRVASVLVRTLLAMAPDFEDLLRVYEEPFDNSPETPPQECFSCGIVGASRFVQQGAATGVPHEADCRLMHLLSRVDKARNS